MTRLPETDWLRAELQGKRIEPVQRLRRGQGVGWVAHRFPIKGGICWLDVMAMNVTKNNALLARLTRARK